MSLGTIHPNLYKTYAKGTKIPLDAVGSLNVFNKKHLLFITFILFSSILVSGAFAAVQLSITDGADRINKTAATGVVWQVNVSNTAGSNALTSVAIINATNYKITAINATGNATLACSGDTNITSRYVNCSGVGFSIPAGTFKLINVTVTMPGAGLSGVGNWTAEVRESDATLTNRSLYTVALDTRDLAFDIYDELGNVSTQNASVQLYNGSQIKFVASNAFFSGNNNGLIMIESGNVSDQQTDTVQFNVSLSGFIHRNQTTTRNDGTTTTYDIDGSNNGFRVTGLLYGIKITVTDELGNAINDPVFNITDQPIINNETLGNGINNTMGNSSMSTANASVDNVFYYALPARFDNVSINVSRSGFLDNISFASFANLNVTGTYSLNASTQLTGNSTYRLIFVLKVNVSDELLDSGVFRAGTTIRLNNTDVTPNQTSGNFSYFSIPSFQHTGTGWNVSASHAGYVNGTDVGGIWGIPLNRSIQAVANPNLPFRLRVAVRNELGTNLFGFGISINDTNTNSTPNVTSGGLHYYNISDSAVNLTVSRDGYINSTNNTDIRLNDSTQAIVSSGHNFTIRVTDICTELGRTGDCFTIDGTMVDVDVHGLAQTNVTYSGGDAYINVSNRVPNTEIILNASKDGFVNRSIAVRVNQTNQTTVVFNSTSATGATTNRTDGLNFTVRVYAVYDELGARNFTINATDRLGQLDGGGVEAGIDVFGQLNQSNYFGPWAYVNATGTAPIVISAYLGNQSFVNTSAEVTPNATRTTLLLYNTTNNIGADVLASGLRYVIAVTVTDELSSARFFTASNNTVNIALNGSVRTPDATSSNIFYFANQTGQNATEFSNASRAGFVNSSAVSSVHNSTNQTTFTARLNFNLKVATQDELANDFQASAVNFSLNNSGNTPNSTSGVYAYFAVPAGASILDSGFAYVNMSKVGWIDNSTNSSGITMTPINTSLQALANVSLAYTVRVDIMCDELNATCFTIDGSTDTDGAGGAATTGIITNYSAGFGGRAFIAAPNGTNTSITAFARGYVNTSTWFIPDASSRNVTVAFNTTPNSTTSANASALPFTVRVISLCTETNSTCLNINGSLNLPSYGGVELAGNTSRYRNSIGYIPVPRTSSVTITVFGPGYVNASNTSVTPTSGTVPINVTFNATTTALKYSLIVNMTDEVNGTGNMGTGLRMTLNGTPGAENKDFFRNSSTSNIYYLNATNSSLEGSANLTFSRDGYINLTRNNTPVNSASQASLSIGLPFSVKVTLQNSDGGTITGLRAVVVDGGSPSGTFKATDGNTTGTRNGASISGDTNTSADGFIYWALNQSNVSGTVDAYVEDGIGVYKTWNSKTGQNINFTTQLSLISANSLEFFSDNTVPTITIVAPTNTSNVTTTTPAFTFIVYDNSSVSGNSGVKFDSIFVNNSGFNRDNDCTIISAYNVTCTSTLALLTDSANNTIIVTAQDRALNNATRSITYVGVDTLAGVTATLNTSDTSGIADGTYANGWSFTFNITLGSSTSNATDVNATAVKVANWTCTSCSTSSSIITTGNTIMNYTISNGTAATYYVSHDYNTTDTIYPLRDLHSTSVPINGTVTVYVKIPAATLPGTYSTTFTFGSWSVALTGGNPS